VFLTQSGWMCVLSAWTVLFCDCPDLPLFICGRCGSFRVHFGLCLAECFRNTFIHPENFEIVVHFSILVFVLQFSQHIA
jgi:hypothetical protein